jgi:hypothetical protein
LENAELDVALEELENRLERLRALYEQYFMGIERIEPQIPRKDIDRRIYVLRREKIRNTAKRFKLQTIISRYNTFQQYWQRICREIENGTYKRHVIRAERIAPGALLTIAARKRLGRHVFDEVEAEAPSPAAVPDSAPPPAAAASPRPISSVPASAGVPRPAQIAAAPAAKALPPPKPPPKPGARPEKPAAVPQVEPAQAAARSFESLDLDMDFMGDWDPTAAGSKSSKGAHVPTVPARPFGEALARPLGAAPIARAATNNPLTAAAQPAPARAAAASAGAPAAAPTAAAPPGAPAPQKPVPTPAAPQPPTQNVVATPAKPAAPASPAIPAAAKLGAVPIAKPAAAKPPATPVASLTDERVRELHARLIEAKRQTQDAGAVSMEGLAKSLKATEAKLREQHKNRKIDFDVVIKDGKAILKPTVR